MTYELVENFAAGLDNRKSPLTAPGGTLTRLTNAVISPGGEIVKRRAFVQVATLPANSFGLAASATTLFVFGRNFQPTVPPSGVPGVLLQGLSVPNANPALDQWDFDIYDGSVYLVAHEPAVAWRHYWAGGAPAGTMRETGGTSVGANIIRTFRSKIYAVGGKYLRFSAVDDPMIWNPSAAGTAYPVASLMVSNPAKVQLHPSYMPAFRNGMLASVAGATAAGLTVANGTHQIFDVDTGTNTVSLGGVSTAGAAGPQNSGVTITPSPGAGAGYINLSSQDSDSEYLTSLEVYYDKLAVFSPEAIQIWAVANDDAQNAFVQLLRGNGTRAWRSPLQYGDGDVLYLDESGIRSMKAKDSSNSASVSDIGSPINSILFEMRRTLGDGYMNAAIALLEPSVGRFWMVFPTQVLVLSYFPGPKITAWSKFTLPFTVQHAVTCGGKVFIRDTANRLFVYGGADGSAYENCGVEIRLPYLNGKKPGHNKIFEAVDLTTGISADLARQQGTWRLAVSYNFINPDDEETVGYFSDPTWRGGRMELTGISSHISFRLYNNDALPASVGNLAVHYQVVDDEA